MKDTNEMKTTIVLQELRDDILDLYFMGLDKARKIESDYPDYDKAAYNKACSNKRYYGLKNKRIDEIITNRIK